MRYGPCFRKSSKARSAAAASALLITLSGACLTAGCARRAAPGAVEATQATPPEFERPPLNADEAILLTRLRAHVAELSSKIGERNPEHPWELAAAADYVALQFEDLGFPVERHGHEVAGAAVQNLAVTVPGGTRGDEVVVVGAYYDSAAGSRGENANASGVAALLELARMFRDAKNDRTLRLVAFALCAPPYAGTEDMGSLRYARELQSSGQKVVGMISLDRVGVLTDTTPAGRGVAQVRLGASRGAEVLLRSLEQELDQVPLAVQLIPLEPSPTSDSGAFAGLGIPAVWVTGIGEKQGVDFDAMTRLVMRVRFGLAEILGETPTNDGMLTPDMGLGG
jgi:hypothetical protein